MALTRNTHEAEDLVQETYLRAIRAVGLLRKDSNAKCWLYTSCETFGSTKCVNSGPDRSYSNVASN
ncbi:MAG TPA: sigma factor [Acidobacteriaceae bacterium]